MYTRKKYLKILDLDISFEEITKMSKFSFMKIVKVKTKCAAFAYLEEQKSKQDKIKDIVYSELKMQEYLADGDRNISVSRTVYRARGQTLNIKVHKKWKYDDTLCSGCLVNEESGEEILRCNFLGENMEKVTYSLVQEN